MSMDLRIELAAGVMVISCNRKIVGWPDDLLAIPLVFDGSVFFRFGQCGCDRVLVSGNEPWIDEHSHDGNRFGSGKRQVIQMNGVALLGAIGGDSVGASTLPEEFAGLGVLAFSQSFELFRRHFAGQSQPFGCLPSPQSRYFVLLVKVIRILQMPLGITGSAVHRPNRQHVSLEALKRRSVSGIQLFLGRTLRRSAPN